MEWTEQNIVSHRLNMISQATERIHEAYIDKSELALADWHDELHALLYDWGKDDGYDYGNFIDALDNMINEGGKE